MKIKTLSLAIATSCLAYFLNSSGAYAAGLGKLTVLSALGQPLRAEIELTSVATEDVGNLFPKLADNDAYRQAKIDFNPVLLSLRFAVEDRGSKHFILITSPQSINEPFLEMLVELTSSSGRLVREYPMVLDLSEMSSTNAAVVDGKKASASGVISTPMTETASEEQKTQQNVKQKAPTISSTKSKQNAKPFAADLPDTKQASYRIKPGDTLEKIAKQVGHQGVSLDQMLVALQRSNAPALINNNMNLIRSGAILTIPDKSEVEGIEQSDAKEIVVAQAIDFDAYRDKLANQVALAEPEQIRNIKRTNSGKITAKVVEKPNAINESADILQLSKAQMQEQADIKRLEENRIAENKAIEATNTRIKELEKNTAKLQKLLALQNEAASTPLNNDQKNVDIVDSATTSTPITPIEAKVPAQHLTEQAKKVVAPTPETNQHFFDQWERYLPYGAIAILLALLSGARIYSSNKRKKTPKQLDDKTGLTDSSSNEPSFTNIKQTEADNNDVITDENATAAELIVKEGDALTEADAYVAYGRDDQAEEILKEALNAQPDQQEIRIRLLEIYARRKDVLSFGLLASDLYEVTGGVGPEWEQVASMGLKIDPDNLLYAGEQSVNTVEVASHLNELTPASSEHEDCPECEKTGMHISPLDFDLGASTSKQEELVQVETSSHSQEKNTQVDTPISPDLDSTITAPAPVEFDFSGIDLELPDKRPQVPTVTTLEEMATKLDLALAYKKIGDKEGARELLNEVMNSGNQEQAERAKAMMNELA